MYTEAESMVHRIVCILHMKFRAVHATEAERWLTQKILEKAYQQCHVFTHLHQMLRDGSEIFHSKTK